MAGELPAYSNWIRQQPCAWCFGPGPCDPHHAESGTTYDPDEAPPAKSAGPKRGRGQRSHDKWLIPLHMRCHRQFTDRTGPFDGWTKEQAGKWEHDQVRRHRQRYAMQHPDRFVAGTATPSRTTRPRATDAASRERLRIAGWLRDKAGARHLKVNEAAVLTDAASELEQQSNGGEF